MNKAGFLPSSLKFCTITYAPLHYHQVPPSATPTASPLRAPLVHKKDRGRFAFCTTIFTTLSIKNTSQQHISTTQSFTHKRKYTMARQYGNNQGVRNLKSAGRSAIKFAGRTTEKSVVGLASWATTDHTGIGRSLLNMPSMGFVDSSRYIFTQFVISIVSVVLMAALAFLLIAVRNDSRAYDR